VNILQQSLSQLEPAESYREPSSADSYDSYLIKTCAALRSKALQEYTVEDLRLMIGQGIGLLWLLPLALVRLQQNLLSEGDYYPGDLLRSVSQVPDSYWREHLATLRNFVQLLDTNLPTAPPADMPKSAFKAVLHRRSTLAALLA
jgi:hypothetical protein